MENYCRDGAGVRKGLDGQSDFLHLQFQLELRLKLLFKWRYGTAAVLLPVSFFEIFFSQQPRMLAKKKIIRKMLDLLINPHV
jgi:hypothetical protein